MPEPTMTVEQIAAALRDLPRPSFRKRLKAALMERTAPMTTVIESQRAVAGRQTAAPRLRVKNAAAAIDFYTRAFGARELMRFEGHGRIAHAELEIGNAIFMLADEAPALIEFVRATFGAEETLRTTGPGGGVHAEVRIGDSMLMIGGGHRDRPIRITPIVTAFHVYVADTDATYARALQAGAESIGEPKDQEYGERSAGVKDRSGNAWYIATAKGEHFVPKGLQTLIVYLFPLRAEPVIAFMKRAFD